MKKNSISLNTGFQVIDKAICLTWLRDLPGPMAPEAARAMTLMGAGIALSNSDWIGAGSPELDSAAHWQRVIRDMQRRMSFPWSPQIVGPKRVKVWKLPLRSSFTTTCA